MTTIVLFSCSSEDLSVMQDKRQNDNEVTLNKISELIGDAQLDLYEQLDSDTKRELWKEKIDHLIHLENQPEFVFALNELRVFVESHNFISLSDDDSNYLDEFVAIAKREFKKSDEYIQVSFMSFEFVNDDSDYNFLYTNKSFTTPPPHGQKPKCNTRCGVWSSTTCGPFDCVDGECEETSWKCGMFFMQKCTGKC